MNDMYTLSETCVLCWKEMFPCKGDIVTDREIRLEVV